MKKNRNSWKKKTGYHGFWIVIPVTLIVTGIVFLFYPFMNEKYHDYKQQVMVSQWRESLDNLDYEEQASSEEEDKEKSSSKEEADKNTDYQEYSSKYQDNPLYEGKEIIGLLEIKSIDLLQPVIKDATVENLEYSVAFIKNGGTPGKIGNFAIAGHNSRTYGRHFNRLNEVKKGDIINLQQRNQTISYEVFDKKIVEADDISILESDGKNSIITLITCYYATDGTKKRLAVVGKMM